MCGPELRLLHHNDEVAMCRKRLLERLALMTHDDGDRDWYAG